jgi:hypothetical protein
MLKDEIKKISIKRFFKVKKLKSKEWILNLIGKKN